MLHCILCRQRFEVRSKMLIIVLAVNKPSKVFAKVNCAARSVGLLNRLALDTRTFSINKEQTTIKMSDTHSIAMKNLLSSIRVPIWKFSLCVSRCQMQSPQHGILIPARRSKWPTSETEILVCKNNKIPVTEHHVQGSYQFL